MKWTETAPLTRKELMSLKGPIAGMVFHTDGKDAVRVEGFLDNDGSIPGGVLEIAARKALSLIATDMERAVAMGHASKATDVARAALAIELTMATFMEVSEVLSADEAITAMTQVLAGVTSEMDKPEECKEDILRRFLSALATTTKARKESGVSMFEAFGYAIEQATTTPRPRGTNV